MVMSRRENYSYATPLKFFILRFVFQGVFRKNKKFVKITVIHNSFRDLKKNIRTDAAHLKIIHLQNSENT